MPEEHKLAVQYEKDVSALKIANIEKRAAEHDKLAERIAAKKAAKAAKAKERLEAEGATEALAALEAATAKEAEEAEAKREEAAESARIEREAEEALAAKLLEGEAKLTEAMNAEEEAVRSEAKHLAAQEEQAMEEFKTEVAEKKASQHDALKARLAAKKAKKPPAELEAELTEAGASPEAAAEIAAASAETAAEEEAEEAELNTRMDTELEDAIAQCRRELEEAMKKLGLHARGKSVDSQGRVVDKRTGKHADGRTHAYTASGHEIGSSDDMISSIPVFRGRAGLRDQRVARAQGRADSKREKAARAADKELMHAQAAFQRAAGSVIGSVTKEKMPKFMKEYADVEVSEEECDAIMIYADSNNNGQLDPQEIPGAVQVWKQIQESADALEEHASHLVNGVTAAVSPPATNIMYSAESSIWVAFFSS